MAGSAVARLLVGYWQQQQSAIGSQIAMGRAQSSPSTQTQSTTAAAENRRLLRTFKKKRKKPLFN